jgi:hypothetical protein
MLLQLRPSNEALRRARDLGALEQRGCPAAPFTFFSTPPIEGVGQMGPQLRASRDHSFIVGPLRARRILCLPPLRS